MRRCGGWARVLAYSPFVLGGLSCAGEDAARCRLDYETEDACANVDDCPAWQTQESGLARAFERLQEVAWPFLSIHYEECEERSTIHFGNAGHNGDYYGYDPVTKDLVEVGTFGDTPDPGNACHSLPSVYCGNTCSLAETDVSSALEPWETPACSGPLAEPLIAACHDVMTSRSEECRACACEACYPQLAKGSDELEVYTPDERFAACADLLCEEQCSMTSEEAP